MYPVAYPISMFLDWLLGSQHRRTYTRLGLGELVREQGRVLSQDELDVITGALELWDKVAKDVLVPMNIVFKLSFHQIITDKLIRDILNYGHSRIPVWKDNDDNIVGIILVKQLLRVNSSGVLSVCDLNILPTFVVPKNYSLFALLHEFRSGASHMAMVTESSRSSTTVPVTPRRRVESSSFNAVVDMTNIYQENIQTIGIVTLEDVIEQLLKRNIEDETDLWKPKNQILDNRVSKLSEMRSDLLEKLSSHIDSASEMTNVTAGKGDDFQVCFDNRNYGT